MQEKITQKINQFHFSIRRVGCLQQPNQINQENDEEARASLNGALRRMNVRAQEIVYLLVTGAAGPVRDIEGKNFFDDVLSDDSDSAYEI